MGQSFRLDPEECNSGADFGESWGILGRLGGIPQRPEFPRISRMAPISGIHPETRRNQVTGNSANSATATNVQESWRIFIGEVSETWRMCKYFQRMLKRNLGDWATWKRLQRCTIAQFLLLVPSECGACFHFHYCPTVQESLQRISASHSPIFNAFGFISFNDWDFGINQPGPAILAVCESHRDVSASFSLPRRRMRSFPCRILPLHID